jgi:hypothetical protein
VLGGGLGLSSRQLSAQVDRGSGERDCQDTRGRAGHDEPSLAEKNSRRERGGIQLRPEPEPGAHPGEAAVCAKRGIPRAGVVDDDGFPVDEVGQRRLRCRAGLELVEVPLCVGGGDIDDRSSGVDLDRESARLSDEMIFKRSAGSSAGSQWPRAR